MSCYFYFFIFSNDFALQTRERKNFKKKKGGESPFLLAVPQLFILSFYPEKASFLAEKSVAKRHQEREKKGDKEKGGRAWEAEEGGGRVGGPRLK